MWILNKLAGVLGVLGALVLPAGADGIWNPGGSGGGTFPPVGCATANGIIFNNATPCDSGLTYAGSGGAVTLASQSILTSPAAATWQLGAANVNGSPVAQILRAQSALAGSATNTASASTTIIGSLGTGTGTNGDIIFQTGVKTTTGTAQATATTALTIKGESQQIQAGVGLTGSATVPLLAVGSANLGFSTGPTSNFLQFNSTNNAIFQYTFNELDFNAQVQLNFFSGNAGTTIAGSADSGISRTAAGQLEINNGSRCSTVANCRELRLRSLVVSGATPTGATGSCAAGTFTGGNTAGTFVAASCIAGTYILTFAFSAPNGWSCDAHDQTTPADSIVQTASSVTTATFAATTAANDVVSFKCMAF